MFQLWVVLLFFIILWSKILCYVHSVSKFLTLRESLWLTDSGSLVKQFFMGNKAWSFKLQVVFVYHPQIAH